MNAPRAGRHATPPRMRGHYGMQGPTPTPRHFAPRYAARLSSTTPDRSPQLPSRLRVFESLKRHCLSESVNWAALSVFCPHVYGLFCLFMACSGLFRVCLGIVLFRVCFVCLGYVRVCLGFVLFVSGLFRVCLGLFRICLGPECATAFPPTAAGEGFGAGAPETFTRSRGATFV